MAERHVIALQPFIKRIVEQEIFVSIINQAGFDYEKADCRLNWGMPEKPDVEALLPVIVGCVFLFSGEKSKKKKEEIMG